MKISTDVRRQLIISGMVIIISLLSMSYLMSQGMIKTHEDVDLAIISIGTTSVLVYIILRFLLTWKPKWFR